MQRIALTTLTLLLSLTIGCGGDENGDTGLDQTESATELTEFPEDCLGLSLEDAETCIEDQFWPAFQDDFDDRYRVYDVMTEVMEEHPNSARAYQLRPLLGVAISMENNAGEGGVGQSDQWIVNMRGDLHKAVELDDSSNFYQSWRISADLTTALFLDNDTVLEAFIEEGLEHAAKNQANLMALITSFMIFPIDSGLPAQAQEMLDGWIAAGHGYETEDSEKYPFGRAGVDYMVGEMYARVGNKEMAFFNYDQARVRGGEEWPYLFLAEEALADLDGRIADFTSFPDDETPITEMVTFGPYACKLCHARR